MTNWKRQWWRASAFASCMIGVTVTGCAARQDAVRPAPSKPSESMNQFFEALEQHRWRDAYALLSSGAQQQMTFEQFSRLAESNPGQLEALARLWKGPGRWETEATFTTKSGRSLRLVREDGQWKLVASTVFLYSQATPLAALTAFVRAFEAKRYDVLLRFVPQSKSEGLDEAKLRAAWEGPDKQDITAWVQRVKGALHDPQIQVLGDRATFALGSGKKSELILEHGDWKILRFE